MTFISRLAGAALCLAAFTGGASAQTELTVIGYGGSFQEGWQKAVIEPFEKANPGIKIKVVTAGTVQAASLMRSQKDNVKVDVMMMDEQGAAQMAREGLYEPLSAKTIPNLDHLHPQFRLPGDVYARFMYTVQVLVYNNTKITDRPTTLDALWNDKYRGRVAVAEVGTTPGMFLLMAMMDKAGKDGKPSEDGGFELMKRIKPNIVTIWSTMAQLDQLFTQGDVWISTWPNNRAQGAIDAGSPLTWVVPPKAYLNASTMGIAKGSKNVAEAQKYIDFALSKEAQAANAKFSYLNPVNKDVVLPPDVAAKLPATPVSELTIPDWNYVLSRLPDWTKRWSREFASQ